MTINLAKYLLNGVEFLAHLHNIIDAKTVYIKEISKSARKIHGFVICKINNSKVRFIIIPPKNIHVNQAESAVLSPLKYSKNHLRVNIFSVCLVSSLRRTFLADGDKFILSSQAVSCELSVILRL